MPTEKPQGIRGFGTPSHPEVRLALDLGRAIGALKIALPYIERLADTALPVRQSHRQIANKDAALIRDLLAEIDPVEQAEGQS